MKYNEAKLIIQSESYLTGADNSIIRRKGDFVETLKDQNVHNQFQKGDIAYEAMGLFTREKVGRYCMVQQNQGSEAKETRRSRLIVRVLLTLAWILLTEAHMMLCNSGS